MKKIRKISVVDDDPITIFGIRKMLDALDICDLIETHANGKLALDAIIESMKGPDTLPDIIFLDINMPIMDGWQFLDAFIELPIEKKIQVNIVTSSIDPADRKKWEYYRARTDHSIEFNNKPIRRCEIEDITRPHIQR